MHTAHIFDAFDLTIIFFEYSLHLKRKEWYTSNESHTYRKTHQSKLTLNWAESISEQFVGLYYSSDKFWNKMQTLISKTYAWQVRWIDQRT